MKSTMNHSRRQLPPVVPHKRKERDEMFDFLKPSTPIIRSSSSKLAKSKPVGPRAAATGPRAAAPSPGPRAVAPIEPFKAVDTLPNNNILLAGYFAHEFLTKGTLFGQLYDPANSKPVPAPSAGTGNLAGFGTMKQPGRGFVNREKGEIVDPELNSKPKQNLTKNNSNNRLQLSRNQRYARVSELLKKGAQIPGIVNPSQLALFLDDK